MSDERQVAGLVAQIAALQQQLAAEQAAHAKTSAQLDAATAQAAGLADAAARSKNFEDQLAELRAKYEAPLPVGAAVQPVTHYRCSDGTCHETVAEAQRHCRIIALMAAGNLSPTQAANLVDRGIVAAGQPPQA